MSDAFDNLFDEALCGADDVILDTMGSPSIHIEIHGEMKPILAVFDEPAADVSLRHKAGEIQDVAPSLFVKTALVQGVKKRAPVQVGGSSFWIVKVGPDDGGTCTITLAWGKPGKPVEDIKQWSR
ncbi:head-tail joining protein [Hafnia paralvei]|uniref:head-tail joining protein n=1 Tax=Hafnia paralvei TaxID=546367 RepID=UPI00300CEA1C